jgi:predicted ATPase
VPFTAQVEALSHQNPVLTIFEDAHWTDPTSLEVFGRIVDRIRSLRVLLIVTFRPEFEPPWIGRPYVMALTINRLAQRDIEAMIDHVVGNKLIPAGVRKDIIERTDGIPLFVEEMTKAVLEAECFALHRRRDRESRKVKGKMGRAEVHRIAGEIASSRSSLIQKKQKHISTAL